jgi:hypothetical protein
VQSPPPRIRQRSPTGGRLLGHRRGNRRHKERRTGVPAEFIGALNQPGRYLRPERRGAGPPKEYQEP